MTPKQFDDIKNHFITAINHELRTPLSIIHSAVSNLVEGYYGDLNEKQAKSVAIIQNNLKNLEDIVDKILQVSQLEIEIISPELEKVHVQSVIDGVLHSFDQDVKARNLKVELWACPDLPCAFTNKNLLQKVLENLIDNAIRFAKEEIVIGINCYETYLNVIISDDGPGIADEDQQGLFQKFSQIHREYGPGRKGLGLGLFLCRMILEKLNGQIGVMSQRGKGASFYFTLPLYRQ